MNTYAHICLKSIGVNNVKLLTETNDTQNHNFVFVLRLALAKSSSLSQILVSLSSCGLMIPMDGVQAQTVAQFFPRWPDVMCELEKSFLLICPYHHDHHSDVPRNPAGYLMAASYWGKRKTTVFCFHGKRCARLRSSRHEQKIVRFSLSIDLSITSILPTLPVGPVTLHMQSPALLSSRLFGGSKAKWWQLYIYIYCIYIYLIYNIYYIIYNI